MTVLPAPPPPAALPFAAAPVEAFFFVPVFILLAFLAFFDVFADALLLFAEDSCKVSSRVFPVAISSLISSVDIILLSETTAVSTGLFSV